MTSGTQGRETALTNKSITSSEHPQFAPVMSDAPSPALTGKRIVFCIDEMASISAGGTERQVLQLVSIAQKIGLLPQICVLRKTEWLTEEIAGCPVKLFTVQRIRSRVGFRKLRDITRWMRQQNFDILQTFFAESNALAPWLGRLAGVPLIIGTRRNLNQLDDRSQRIPYSNRLGQRLSNRLVDRILCNSQAVLSCISQTETVPLAKMRVIYNGIDARAVKPRPGMRASMRTQMGLAPSHVLVGNVSGLRWIKGVDLFIEAAAIAYQANPSLRFVVVGDGKERSEIESLIKTRQLTSVVEMAGAIEDVRPYLAAMDIAVLSSRAEGFSNSILEYMVAGLPTIATDVGGNREALGKSGLLVPADDAARLADAIRLLECQKERDRYGLSAQRAAARYDLSTTEDCMRVFYEEELGMKARVRR